MTRSSRKPPYNVILNILIINIKPFLVKEVMAGKKKETTDHYARNDFQRQSIF
jgi:hypothetical protein